MTKAGLGLIGGAILFTFILVTPVTAQQPTPSDDQVNALAKDMYCPVCENTPLDVCPTQACAQWRELIRQKLEQGWSKQQIKDYFVAQYGDHVLAEPPAIRNFYVIPLVFLLAAILVVYRIFISAKKEPLSITRQDEGIAEFSSDDPYQDRVEAELNIYRKS